MSEVGGADLAKAFMSLSPKLRRAIVELARAMAIAERG